MSAEAATLRPRTHSFIALTYIGVLLAAGLAGLAVSVIQQLPPEAPSSEHLWGTLFAFTLGYTLAIGLVAAAGFYWFVLRRSGRSPMLYVAGILGWVWLVVFLGVGLIAYPRAVVSVRSNLNGEVRAYLQASLQQRETDRQRFAALDIANVLTPDHLTTPEGIADARRRIAEAGRLTNEQVQGAYSMQNQASARISAINPAAGARFTEASARARIAVDQAVQQNVAILAEMSACVDILERNRSGWTVAGQVLTFTDDGVLQEYSGHLTQLRRLSEQSQALGNQMEERLARVRAAIDAPDPLGAYVDAISSTAPAPSP